jgi:putative transposase
VRADNSKGSYSSGLDALAWGLDAWAKSRRGARKGRRVGFPRFKTKNGARRCFKVTAGAFGPPGSSVGQRLDPPWGWAWA